MSSPLPPYGVISLAALDLRRRPDHKAEMTSQLLLGERVRVLGVSRDGQWWRVENHADGYVGWIRTWGVVGVGAGRAASWERLASARVTAAVSEATTEPGGGDLVSPLFFNSRLVAGRAKGGFRKVELPDGRQGWVPAGALAPRRSRPPGLLARIRSLLGTPYLWGGRSPLGFDCSGFVQQVLVEQGVSLPRDAEHQLRATERLPAGKVARKGDLVFFGPVRGPAAHVGIGLGNGTFAHCRGRVRINSETAGNPLFDKELMESFRGWRRLRE